LPTALHYFSRRLWRPTRAGRSKCNICLRGYTARLSLLYSIKPRVDDATGFDTDRHTMTTGQQGAICRHFDLGDVHCSTSDECGSHEPLPMAADVARCRSSSLRTIKRHSGVVSLVWDARHIALSEVPCGAPDGHGINRLNFRRWNSR